MSDQATLASQRKQLIAEGRFAEARDVAQEMLAKQPSDPALHHQMAWSMAAVKDFEGAVRSEEKAIGLAPKNAAYRLALAKYLEGRAEQERVILRKLGATDAASFGEMQQIEKRTLLKQCQSILTTSLGNWPHRVDFDDKLRTKWVLQSQPLDSVEGWHKYIPEKFKPGDVAEIIGVGSFATEQTSAMQSRLLRGIPWKLHLAHVLMELASRADPKSVVVEIGANIGTLTVPIALNFRGRVLAFEAVEGSFLSLKRNLKINEIDNVRARMKTSASESAPATSQDGIQPSGHVSAIEDILTQEKSPVSIIKIGAEDQGSAVLNCSGGVIARYKPVVVCEFSGDAGAGAVKLMTGLGYQAKRLFRSDWIFFPG